MFSEYLRRHSFIFITITCLIVGNGLQSSFTELANDEAYYWVYAQYMDWGYFDHPPMIAFFIKCGSLLFPGEFGVRCFIVVLNALTFLTMSQLVGKEKIKTLLILSLGVTVFHVYGFIAVPDAPLLFFTSLFFLRYKLFLLSQNKKNIIWLSVVITLLLYSKYHGVLVLFFALLSNLHLFKKKSFYAVLIISLILFMPHIIWQISNDYPSYKYHVLNKSQSAYNPTDSISFLLGQLLIFGPLTSGIIFYSAFKMKMTNGVNRALKFTLIGFILFFLVSTLNASVEPNWTVPILIPLLVLTIQFIDGKEKKTKILFQLSKFMLILFIAGRVFLMTDIWPNQILKKSEFHGWKKWANDIDDLSNNKPVVFMNSYQKASKYFFYTENKALSLNNVMYRRNQFDLWEIASSFQGEDILFIPNYKIKEYSEFSNSKETFNYLFMPNFRSYNKVWIQTNLQKEVEIEHNTLMHIDMDLINQFDFSVPFNANLEYPVRLVCVMFRQNDFFSEHTILSLDDVVLKERLHYSFDLNIPKESDVYYLRIGLKAGSLPVSINSDIIRMTVK